MKPELPQGFVAQIEHHDAEDEVYAGHEGPIEQLDLFPGKEGLPVITPLLGYTFAYIYREDDTERKQPLATGVAMCGAGEGTYFFNVGRDIALGRALKNLELKQTLEGAEVL